MLLTNALRIGASLLILAVVYHYASFGVVLIKSIVVAHILFILSFFSDKHAQRIAVVTLGLAIVVPIGAWRSYQEGTTQIAFFIFNVIIFLYAAYAALQTLQSSKQE